MADPMQEPGQYVLTLRGEALVEVSNYMTTSKKSPTPGIRLIFVRTSEEVGFVTRLDDPDLKVIRG